MKLRLFAATLFLFSAAGAGLAGERQPADWPEGWGVHRNRDCTLHDRSVTCRLYAGTRQVGVARARIERQYGFREALVLKVQNATRCQMTVWFEIRQPDAFGPQKGRQTDAATLSSGGTASLQVPLFWKNGLRRVHFDIIPQGDITSCR